MSATDPFRELAKRWYEARGGTWNRLDEFAQLYYISQVIDLLTLAEDMGMITWREQTP